MSAHAMTSPTIDIKEFIAGLFPFNRLSAKVLEKLSAKIQVFRYRMGQLIMARETMPQQISIIYQGQARLLVFDSRTEKSVTLKLLAAGEILGWVSHVRGMACETVVASTEVVCLNFEITDFLSLMHQEAAFAEALHSQATLIEIYDLLTAEFHRRADGHTDLIKLAHTCFEQATILSSHLENIYSKQLNADFLWLVSSSSQPDFPVGSRFDAKFRVSTNVNLRLLGLPQSLLQTALVPTFSQTLDVADIPYAPKFNPQPELVQDSQPRKYPYIRGRGQQDAALACFQMLSQYFNVTFRRDMLRRVISTNYEKTGGLSLPFCAAVAELLGLTTQMVRVPATAVVRLQFPVMISWQDSFAIIYKNSNQQLLIAVPEMGLIRRKVKDFAETWGSEGEVLLLQANKHTPKSRFGLSWFVPSLRRYRKVLIEVLIASMVVQIFGLVNPLVTQVVIDKVIIGNSPDTLEVFGIFLIVVSIVEAVLTAIRTQLFVDTTNRIDLSLGSEVINHLLRLPLSYFERRPVGELATRVGELENIRSFLTGTALTVVMDAIFSVVYILVMTVYSPLLTVVGLATVPLFALLNLLVSPVMRRQLQAKAERNAETHSYLVEIMGGMQTVKAQNLEMRSRWQWQERYARYISAGFKTVSTQTTASSVSSFLNKFSSLLVLWVGAYLVLHQQLTLGQLMAFRILSGYVTSPLLRLVQLWQNFQETALSLQRLSDIIDSPQETEADTQNILMPTITGSVRYENLSFSFQQNGQLQLCNINLDIPTGSFVGIVGQSGSGKSTLLKLLPRLYEPKSGKIVIDGYDISKVELYSLRRQIGMVLQDTLLFDGTVRENIALASPDAGDEEIVTAAKIAYAHDFIMSLPNGYNTQVGERGSGLSGGQRQRIAIARTVLQNPQILVLDEATSALDYNAEAQVCRNLAEAFHQKTVFFITHRLSTIRNADIILMMDSGSIVEQGTHAELMSLKGYYYCLYQQQDGQI
ncbi:peptidase domain-containing ABC transporter [Calothrix sp. PCC 7507]|uniref:peptidase domain-containing ABC transporter n=1 Tax=Calothrix sp. PCC 7507 TaxID=99598 RepID=UPI00029EF362|nr:cyclic nucleotide-regulated ABC bacteriocin/lantibiotic exporter [Calothrix sp. PCC 7507]